MRFEIEVDDGANLDRLHQAREAYNAAHKDAPIADMPSFVQRLADDAVTAALAPFLTLGQASAVIAARDAKIAQLQAERDAALAQAAQNTVAPAT